MHFFNSQELDSKIPNFTGRFDDFGVQASVSSVKSTMFGFQWHMPRFMAHRWGASFGVHRKNDNRVETSSYNLLSRGYIFTFNCIRIGAQSVDVLFDLSQIFC
jgi:hypothetical protein